MIMSVLIVNSPLKLKNGLNKRVVVKSNNLIQASYNLKLTQIRLWLLVLSKIGRNDTSLSSYRVYNHELRAFVGKKHKDYLRVVKRCAKDLMKEVIEIPLPDGSVLQTAFLSGVRYSKQGFADFSFHEDLKPYLVDIHDNFTSYVLENISRLPSPNSIRMYQITKQYENIPKVKLDIEAQLKKWLGLQGKYSNTNDFIRNVIQPAREDMIDNECDVYFDYELINEGRKIVALNFYPKKTIKALPPALPDSDTDKTDIEALRTMLAALGLTKNQIKKYLDCSDPDLQAVSTAIEIAKSRFEDGKVKNVTGYLYKLLEAGPQKKPKFIEENEEKESRENEKILKAKRDLEIKKRKDAEDQLLIEKLQNEFEAKRNEEQEKIIARFTAQQWADFEKYARKLPTGQDIFRNGKLDKKSPSFQLWVKVFASSYQPEYHKAFIKWAHENKGFVIEYVANRNTYQIVGRQQLLL